MPECKIIMVQPQPTAVVRVTADMGDLMKVQKDARAKITEALPKLNAGIESYGCTLWHPPVKGRMYMEPGFIVMRSFKSQGGVESSELPGGRVATYVVHGPYDGLPGAWKLLLDWVEQKNLSTYGTNWEIYGDDHPDPAKLKTSLFVLLK